MKVASFIVPDGVKNWHPSNPTFSRQRLRRSVNYGELH
jgi:hypothetical protein